jgi:hypothetical protein
MKRRRAKRRKSSANHLQRRPPAAVSFDRRIILLDDAPWRKRAAADCKRELAKLDQARAEWQRYQQKDQPAFARWTAVTFGPLLTEYRDNVQRIEEQETFIEEVEMEMTWSSHCHPREAYAAVKKRWDNPDSADDFTASDGSAREEGAFVPGNGMDDDIPAGASAALFDEFVRCLGVDPKSMPEDEFEKIFDEFEATILGGGPADVPPGTRAEKKPAMAPAEARLKETYRVLVRRLHPDLRAAADATVSAVWHEVQEAYQAGNLERLETLLALTQMQDGTNGGQASLSQMRGALEELRHSLRSLQRSIKKAKREPAWAFSQTEDHTPLAKRLRRELEEGLSEQRRVLADHRRILDDWSRPMRSPSQRPGRQQGKARNAKAGHHRHASDVPHRPVQADLFPF